MPSIRQTVPEVTLEIIGDGHARPRFEKLARAFGVDDCITFQGSIHNVELPRYYQGAEVLVFPSIIASDGDREGLGLVPVEAMGCGCGVIVTDLEALEDVVEDRINGLVVRQRSPEAIAEAVVSLLQDRYLLGHLRAAGRHRVVKSFDWSKVAQDYQNLIQNLIDGDN
jgi:glycosyltransferase involved in cell wall biosynthesis